MVQLTWPHAGTDWRYYLSEISATYVQMASAISRRERLLVVSPCPGDVRAMLGSVLTEWQMSNVTFHECLTDDTWARDHAFITLKDADGGNALLDFRFNGWGDKYPGDLDNAINSSLYGAGVLHGRYENHNDFVLEGGSIESDGRGTLLTTSRCLLAPGRNQPLQRTDIERELLRRLHCKRLLWIDHGHVAGDDTDGHIDTMVRMAPRDTLLYIRGDEADDEHRSDLKLMEEQLRTFRTIDGRPYRLIALPMPEPIYDGDDRLPATYANFLVINGAVLVPVYGQPDTDRRAIEAIREAFPGREMIAVDSRVIIRQHGSVHCCAMQYPE